MRPIPVLLLISLALCGCERTLVRSAYSLPGYERHYAAAADTSSACRSAAAQAARLCTAEARASAWPVDVRCGQAEWHYADYCNSP